MPFLKIKMFLVTFGLNIPILRSDVMHMVLTNECNSCEISNQMLLNVNVLIFENKRRTGYDINIAK